MTSENPRTFYWEYQEQRGKATPVGPDGFLATSATTNPQLTVEVTLRFEGKDLKGYTDVYDVEKEYAPTEVFLNNCFTDDFFVEQ